MELEEDLINTVNDIIDYDKAIEYSKKQEQLPKISYDVACISYTSGTTGDPKGVAITHGAITNSSVSYTKIRVIGPNDRCAFGVIPKETFVEFLCDLFLNIYIGFELYIANNQDLMNPTLFHAFLMKNKIEDTFFPAVMIDSYLNNVNNPFLKNIYTGGDKVRLTKLVDSVKVIVGYGLTESFAGVTYYKVDSLNKPSCIGKPFLNTHLYVLDNDYKQCEKNQIGQIALSGIQISNSYLNDIEETKRHFIDNPYFNRDNDEEHYNKLVLTGDYG